MSKLMLGLLLAGLAGQAAGAAELGEPGYSHHVAYHRYIALPPERHVIEIVRPPNGGVFMINRAYFTAKTDACFGWAAGERVRLVAGDWHGQCSEAVFYNVTRRSTCAMWCG